MAEMYSLYYSVLVCYIGVLLYAHMSLLLV